MTPSQSQLARLNPHLLKFLPAHTFVRQATVDPALLVTPARFDVAVKHVYARHRHLGSTASYHRDLYTQHVGAITHGLFKEDDGSRGTSGDYVRIFDELLDSIQVRGFDPDVTMVPVGRGLVPLDGAHRVAACVFFKRPVTVLEFDVSPAVYDSRVLSHATMPVSLAGHDVDQAAVEYCRMTPLARIVTLFPVAQDRGDRVREILTAHGSIVHEKAVAIRPGQGLNVIRELYLGEPWLGTWRDGYGGAAGKGGPCFARPGPMTVFVVHASTPDALREAKREIRAMWPHLGNDAVHATDTQVESLRVARALVHDRGVDFINRFRGRYFQHLEVVLESWRAWLDSCPDDDAYCLDAGAVLGACGLREPVDLDALHLDKVADPAVAESHNAYAPLYSVPKDRIVMDPTCHFWTRGVKFAWPSIVAAMKRRREEPKDFHDACNLDEFVTGS